MDDEKFERAVGFLEGMGKGDPEREFVGQTRMPLASLSRRLAPGDPVGSLAGDLCEMAVCGAMPPEEIVRTAAACREAAEICYGKPSLRTMTREEFDREQTGGIDPNGLTGKSPFVPPYANVTDEAYGLFSPHHPVNGGLGFGHEGFIDPGVEGEPQDVADAAICAPFRVSIPPPPAAVEGAQAVIQGPEDLSDGPHDIYAPAAHVSFTLDEAALRRHDGSEGGDR